MSSPFTSWFSLTIPQGLRLLAIVILAVVICYFLRKMTSGLAKPAASQGRAAQAHEQQTRALADLLYRVSSRIVWGVAVLTALPEFGIAVWPAVVLAGAGVLGRGNWGAEHRSRRRGRLSHCFRRSIRGGRYNPGRRDTGTRRIAHAAPHRRARHSRRAGDFGERRDSHRRQPEPRLVAGFRGRRGRGGRADGSSRPGTGGGRGGIAERSSLGAGAGGRPARAGNS